MVYVLYELLGYRSRSSMNNLVSKQKDKTRVTFSMNMSILAFVRLLRLRTKFLHIMLLQVTEMTFDI